jgi:preprotein translocase subunit SecF
MELFKIGRTIPFMRHALILNAISFITFILAVFFIVTRGIHRRHRDGDQLHASCAD